MIRLQPGIRAREPDVEKFEIVRSCSSLQAEPQRGQVHWQKRPFGDDVDRDKPLVLRSPSGRERGGDHLKACDLHRVG